MKLNILKLTLTIVLGILSIAASAQEKYTLKGQVLADDGSPLVGATVQVQNNEQSWTVAGPDGSFTIDLGPKDAITVSMLSYSTVTLPVNGRKSMIVTLSPDSQQLEETVVVGYATSSIKDISGSVARADVEAMQSVPTTSVADALQGRIAGVQISSSDGQPGSEMNIVIRGSNSVTQSNSPLYVVDGFPTEDYSIMAVNSEDIKSISVLKDASATAIYGSRAANGVVIIETKSGQGKCTVNYSGSVSVQQASKFYEMMSPYEFVKYLVDVKHEQAPKFLEEMGRDLDYYKTVDGHDWQREMIRPAIMHSHSLSVSGSSASTKYFVSGSYIGQDGILKSTGMDKAQIRAKIEQKIGKRLTLSANLSYTYLNIMGSIASERTGTGTWQSYLMYRLWSYSPIGFGSVDETGDIDNLVDVNQLNPVISAQNTYRKLENKTFAGNITFTWNIAKGLDLKNSFNYSNNNRKIKTFANSKSYGGFVNSLNPGGINGSFEDNDPKEWVNETILNYKTKFGWKNNFSALAGFTMQEFYRDRYRFATNYIPNDALGTAGLSTGTVSSLMSQEYRNSGMSFLARANYSYMYKYIITASVRADGSSRFPNHKWGVFPSAAVAWRLKGESFLANVDAVSEAKIRFSWGLTGNNRISDYAGESTIGYVDYYAMGNAKPSIGSGVTSIANPDLKWETTEQYNLGIDFGMFDERIRITADIYRKNTKDMLLSAYVPTTTGLWSAYLNVGSVRNDGLEISLNTVNIKTRNFTWSSNFNIAFNRNEVLSLANGQDMFTSNVNWTGDFGSTPLYITKVGAPITAFYGLTWDGNYQYEDFNKLLDGTYVLKDNVPDNGNDRNTIQPGDIKYVDLNGDLTVNEQDMSAIGRAFPIHTGGFTNDFKYKGIGLSVFLQWSYGNEIMNANRIVLEGNYTGWGLTNQLKSYVDRWTPDNQDSENYRAGGYGPKGVYSTRTLEDGSYLRIKNIVLSYDLPSKWTKKMKMRSAQAYLSVQNAWTFTNYSGIDPEVSTFQSNLTPGFDYSAYPRTRVYSFGLKIGF